MPWAAHFFSECLSCHPTAIKAPHYPEQLSMTLSSGALSSCGLSPLVTQLLYSHSMPHCVPLPSGPLPYPLTSSPSSSLSHIPYFHYYLLPSFQITLLKIALTQRLPSQFLSYLFSPLSPVCLSTLDSHSSEDTSSSPSL